MFGPEATFLQIPGLNESSQRSRVIDPEITLTAALLMTSQAFLRQDRDHVLCKIGSRLIGHMRRFHGVDMA